MEYKHLIETLNAYKNFKSEYMADKLSQAYLFICEDKLTADEFATSLAKLLVCNNYGGCGVCSNCLKVKAGSHPDVMVYPKGKMFVVGDASDIYDNVQIKPMLTNKKIFVINGIDNSTEQAQNKMLKIIEEPPQNVVFILTAQNENKVLGTIKSRAQKITIDRLDEKQLETIIDAEAEIKNIAICNGGGYLGKTYQIVNDVRFIEVYNNIKNLILNLKNSTQIPQFSKTFGPDLEGFNTALIILNDFFRDVLMLKLGQVNLVKNKNLVDGFSSILLEYSVMALNETLKRLNNIKKKLDSNVNLTLLADNMLLEILEVKFLCK